MIETRTEYAVRYTEHRDGTKGLDVCTADRTDLSLAQVLLANVREWQANANLPADAELVTRTITTSGWEVT